MIRTSTLGLVTSLAAALSIAAFAGFEHEGNSPTPQQRKEFQERHKESIEKRLAKLPAEEQKLARTLQPLRDSLMRTMGDYKRKVKDGAAARSLTAERSTIASLEAQIQKLQSDNREVWLDLLADLPGPEARGGPGGPHGKFGKGGPECPKRSDKDCPRHGDGELPPPPPPIE
jgi:Spy/CpxP family protein refolding chaperone